MFCSSNFTGYLPTHLADQHNKNTHVRVIQLESKPDQHYDSVILWFSSGPHWDSTSKHVMNTSSHIPTHHSQSS